MGLLNVVTLSAELTVLLWYALTPVTNQRAELVREDLRAALHFKQSLAAMAALSLLRVVLFIYIRQASKRAPATRLFVFFVFLFEAVLCALSCLQPVIFWQDAHSFQRFRGLPWGVTYVYTLWVLSLFSSMLQFGYILQLNHSRGKLADDSLMRDVLGERSDLLAPSTSLYYQQQQQQHDDVRLALWRTKWAQLVKQFKKKQTDPTFEAIVRLYAHRDGAVERLAGAYERNPQAFEFYLPQLCSFLLHGAFVQSPQLCVILLEKCSLSHVFAHKVLWYLQSYCVASPAFPTEENNKRVKMLIEEVSDRGQIPARAVEFPPVDDASESHQQGQNDNDNDYQQQQRLDQRSGRRSSGGGGMADRHTLLSCAPQEVEALLSQRDDDHYFTFQDLERGGGGNSAMGDPFERETTFLNALANLSSNLRSVAYNQRNNMLRQWLLDIEAQYLPSNSLYLPVGDPYHRLKRIHVEESFTFSTRERVPYLLCAEVVSYPSPLEVKKARRKRGSMFKGRRFTLSLWDSSSQSDLLKAAASGGSTGSGPAGSGERPPMVSPDAAKLGFWSEHKPISSPRKRSFSQHITSSIPQPGELFNGLIDTLVQKMPGAAKNNSNNSNANSSANDVRGTPHEALLGSNNDHEGENETGSQTTNKLLCPSQPFSNDVSKFSLTIDTSGSGGSNGVAYGRRVAPGPHSPTGAGSITQYEPEDSMYSPKSDTLLSPQSLGSPTSPRPLVRFDSTDQFLLTLSERDSKWMMMDEQDESNEAGPPSATRRGGDQPLVIFTERWADKERRIQAKSEFGDQPGWRLLPVIVKSNDDLRQEQLAAQLIQQFAKVFEEGKLPVFLRPYDVIAISPTAGLVEAIADTISIDSLKRNDRAFTTLLDFFVRHFGEPGSSEFRKARSNFVSSMAGYAIVCYLLQVKDRHNGNILLDAEGHIIHIDFGFILSNNPGNMAFEQAPFKLTSDFVELMGGPRSASFRQFRSLCVRAFLVARKYRHRFILLVEMMLNGNEHLPCFAGDPKGTVERLAARFQPELDINSCEDFVHSLIDASLDNWRTKWYDKYQRCAAVVYRHVAWSHTKSFSKSQGAAKMNLKRKKKPTPKLHPGWRPGRKKRRQVLAATMIQKCFRSYLLRKAFRANRSSVTQSFQALRAFHHARDRRHWRSVDLHTLKREELRLVALSLNLPSTGKKVLLLGRIQRWVDQHVRVNDLAGEAAAKALETHAKGQGAVYFCEAYPGAEPIDIRPLRGKGITSVAAGPDSDAVYAVDATRGALWLCKTGGLSSQVGLCSTLPSSKRSASAQFDDPIESRWLVNPVFMHTLRTEHVVNVQVARSHTVALAEAGELFSWGDNPHGELGFPVESADAVARNRATVVAAIATYRAVAVAVGRHHTIAVCDGVAGHDGVTFCWGSNSYEQLGATTIGPSGNQKLSNSGMVNGSSVAFPKPFVIHQVELLRAVNIRKVACGALHSMALSVEGKVFSWGCNDGGRLGHGDFKAQEQIGKPTMVRGRLETLVVLEIACGTWHSACIAAEDQQATSGRVFTWGTGIYGQLGANVQQVLHEPHYVRVPQSKVVNEQLATQIACGMHHTAVLMTENQVFMWGSVQQFSPHPQKVQLRDGSSFGRIASLSCGRTFVLFNTLSRNAESYEKHEAHRLWRVQPTVIPRLDLRKIPPVPLSSSCFSAKKSLNNHSLPPLRLEPQVDRKAREQAEAREAQRIEDIDIDAIVHPLCRVCWRCEGFQPSPLKLWVCRHCFHEKQLHGLRPKGAPLGEYEAIRKLQCLYRARKARRLLQKAREKHYQRVFSIKHNAFFYYNLWRDKVSWQRPPEIGLDVDIPIRDPDVLPTIKPPLTKVEAATIMQASRRGCLARRAMKKRLQKMYEKHFDLEKEQVYYIARQGLFGIISMMPTGKSKVLWTPPALLQHLYDLGDPIEIQRLKRFASMTPDDAARVLQSLFRAFQQRKRVKKTIQSRYKKIFDDTSGLHFYYNMVTKESTWEKPKLLRDNEDPKSDEKSKSTASTKATSASPQKRRKRQPRREKFANPDAAARTIQALFRRFVCRKQFFELLSRRYHKLMDPNTGKPYYYDTVLHAASWLKPAMFGEFDLGMDEEEGTATTGASSRNKSLSARKSTIVPEALKSSSPRKALPISAAAAGPHMSERARVKRHKRRLQKLRQMSRDDAACRLQRMWRARKARDQLRQLLFEAYEKIYDPTTDHYYYNNKKTGVVKWEKPWMIDDQDVRVVRRIKRRRVDAIVDPQEAAGVLQGFMRYCVARNKLYRLLYARIQKVWDPQTRQYYYFDKRNGQSSWKKPVTLRYNDLPAT